MQMIQILQGKHVVSSKPDVALTAVLGSCVAACILDPVARVGGMNHFLLPGADARGSQAVVYGAQSMELLINGIIYAGGRKDRMQAKLFGGARVMSGLSDIGSTNATFALRFLKDEGIPCIGQSLGGVQARRVRFFPISGRADQKRFAPTPSLKAKPAPVSIQDDVTMF